MDSPWQVVRKWLGVHSMNLYIITNHFLWFDRLSRRHFVGSYISLFYLLKKKLSFIIKILPFYFSVKYSLRILLYITLKKYFMLYYMSLYNNISFVFFSIKYSLRILLYITLKNYLCFIIICHFTIPVYH